MWAWRMQNKDRHKCEQPSGVQGVLPVRPACKQTDVQAGITCAAASSQPFLEQLGPQVGGRSNSLAWLMYTAHPWERFVSIEVQPEFSTCPHFFCTSSASCAALQAGIRPTQRIGLCVEGTQATHHSCLRHFAPGWLHRLPGWLKRKLWEHLHQIKSATVPVQQRSRGVPCARAQSFPKPTKLVVELGAAHQWIIRRETGFRS